MKKQYQLSEFQFYDGEEFITFNLIDINTEKKEITVAVTDRGHISVRTFDNETYSCKHQRTETQFQQPALEAGLQLCHRPLE